MEVVLAPNRLATHASLFKIWRASFGNLVITSLLIAKFSPQVRFHLLRRGRGLPVNATSKP